MSFIWYDYRPAAMSFVESWLDESAVRTTGLEDGFRAFYEYWANEDGFAVGKNFWCKVVSKNDQPFAVVALCQHKQTIIVMEVLVAPEQRGQGKGSKLLKELLASIEIIGCAIQSSEAMIYPDNTASQRAFENAGFSLHHNNKDENGESMHYVYEKAM